METHLLLPLMTRLIMLQKGSRMNPSGASLVGNHVATKEAADSDKGGVKCIRSSAQNVKKIQLSLSSQEAIAQFTAVIASAKCAQSLHPVSKPGQDSNYSEPMTGLAIRQPCFYV